MLGSFTLILACQLVGETLVALFGLPLPGSVLGLLLLFLVLLARRRIGRSLERVSRGILANLGLLFVPVAVGMMTQVEALTAEAVPIAAAVLIGTVVTMLVTGWTMQVLDRRSRKEQP